MTDARADWEQRIGKRSAERISGRAKKRCQRTSELSVDLSDDPFHLPGDGFASGLLKLSSCCRLTVDGQPGD